MHSITYALSIFKYFPFLFFYELNNALKNDKIDTSVQHSEIIVSNGKRFAIMNDMG